LKRVDLNTDEGFAPGNATFNGAHGFNMAFGFQNGIELDPRIGTWKIEYVSKKYGEEKVVEEIPLKKCKEVCKKCDDDSDNTLELKDSCGWSQIDYFGTGLENLYCSNAFHKIIKGDFFSKEFKYVKIGVKSCEKALRSECADETEVKSFFA
jgi:hypothetical protein